MRILELPEGYSEIKRVNLQADKKTAIFVNVGAFLLMILLFLVGALLFPFSFDITADNSLSLLLRAFAIIIAIVLYLIAHELVHGIFIKKFSGRKAKYGFTGLYAYAGSDAYFNKRHYIIIALSPIILWGVIFFLLNIFLSNQWFWPIYLLQIVNLSGAAGDLYITWIICRAPSDVLTKDVGIEMILYSRTA